MNMIKGFMLLALLTPSIVVAAGPDLTTFCLASKPSDTVLAHAYATYCPDFLANQFFSQTNVNNAQNDTTRLTQQLTESQITTAGITQLQTQDAIINTINGLSKPPIPQSKDSFDLSALGGPAQIQSAKLIFNVAKTIGHDVQTKLGEQKTILLTNQEYSALFSSPVEPAVIEKLLDYHTSKLTPLVCKGGVNVLGVAPLSAIVALQTIITGGAAIANAFQPSLIASTKLASVSDSQQLMSAGVQAGFTKKELLYTRVPNIDKDSLLLRKYDLLRNSIISKKEVIDSCAKNDPAVVSGNLLLADATAFITSITKTDGTKPSLLDVAAKRQALETAGVNSILILSLNVETGGISAIKPNAFFTVRLLSSSAVSMSYQLLDFSGHSIWSDMVAGIKSQNLKLADWPKDIKDENQPVTQATVDSPTSPDPEKAVTATPNNTNSGK